LRVALAVVAGAVQLLQEKSRGTLVQGVGHQVGIGASEAARLPLLDGQYGLGQRWVGLLLHAQRGHVGKAVADGVGSVHGWRGWSMLSPLHRKTAFPPLRHLESPHE
jgi:hypothetical protein